MNKQILLNALFAFVVACTLLVCGYLIGWTLP